MKRKIEFLEASGTKVAFASPSYKRPLCRTAHYIPETRVYVDPSEYDDYVKANGGFGEIVACDEGIQGNLPRVRNYILDKEFERGADIVVMMDDDVTALATYKPNEKGYGYCRNKLDAEAVREFVIYGSQICKDWGFGMWGVNYNQDPLLYKHYQPFSTTKAAVGQFMVFVENELRFDESLPLKEDYDMAVQQMNRYRGVLLINWAHVNADFGELAGGTSVRRNFEREKEQFFKFRKKWGSEIVKDVNRVRGQGGSRMDGSFLGKYDFSHPVVRTPIKGI